MPLFAVAAIVGLCATTYAHGQADLLPDAPSALLASLRTTTEPVQGSSSLDASSPGSSFVDAWQQTQAQSSTDARHGEPDPKPDPKILPQEKRVFGVLTNFTSVSGGTKPKPAGWKTDAKLVWKQSGDYSAISFSVVTSAIAYAQDTHPLLDTVNGGNAPFWAYTWRGLLDKTDGSVQGAFFFPALLHQDTRYFAMGTGPKWKRALHAADSVVIARSYSGNPVFNAAGIIGKVGTQAVSTTYYPAGSEAFGVLAEKFGYACLRQAGFTILKEFSPDLAEHLHFHVKGSR